ncbi:sensor domain-containing protein [Streptomyces sp. NPDC001770]
MAAFTLAVTGFALGVSTLVVWIGLPTLAGTLRAAGAWPIRNARCTAP